MEKILMTICLLILSFGMLYAQSESEEIVGSEVTARQVETDFAVKVIVPETHSQSNSWFENIFKGIKPFTPEAFKVFQKALPIMGWGMFGVFFFMFLFYLVIKLLCRIYKDEEVKE